MISDSDFLNKRDNGFPIWPTLKKCMQAETQLSLGSLCRQIWGYCLNDRDYTICSLVSYSPQGFGIFKPSTSEFNSGSFPSKVSTNFNHLMQKFVVVIRYLKDITDFIVGFVFGSEFPIVNGDCTFSIGNTGQPRYVNSLNHKFIMTHKEVSCQAPETTKGHLNFRDDGIVHGLVKAKHNVPDFQAWRQWLRPGDVLFNSEVGMVEQIRWIEINNTTALSNAKGAGSVLGEGLVFGDDGVALAEVETPELRAAIPGNFGRYQAVAWYGVLAYGLIWSATGTAGEARVIYITGNAA